MPDDVKDNENSRLRALLIELKAAQELEKRQILSYKESIKELELSIIQRTAIIEKLTNIKN